MLTSSIGLILIVTGLITAGGGIAALLSPKLFLRLGFGDESPSGTAVFFARHWGVLIIAIGELIAYSTFVPALRTPILVAAVAEKILSD